MALEGLFPLAMPESGGWVDEFVHHLESREPCTPCPNRRQVMSRCLWWQPRESCWESARRCSEAGEGCRITSFALDSQEPYRESTSGHNPMDKQAASFRKTRGVCFCCCLCPFEGRGPTRDSQIHTVHRIPGMQSDLTSSAIKGFLLGGSHKSCSHHHLPLRLT